MRPDLQAVVDEAAALLDAPVTLEDRDFHLVAFAAHDAPVDGVRQASILQRRSTPDVRAWFEGFGIATATGPVHVPADGPRGVAARLCLPARWRDVTYGYLWVVEDPAAGPVDGSVDGGAAEAAMRLAGRAGAVLAQQARARDDVAWLLDDVLAADGDAAERAAETLTGRGLVQRSVRVVAVAVTVPPTVDGGRTPANLWELPRGVLARPGDGLIDLLVPVGARGEDAAVAVARQAVDLVRRSAPDGSGIVAGVGDPRPDLVDARASRHEALVAVRAATAVPALGPVARWSALGVHRLLACGARALADAVLEPPVARLLATGDDDLVRTARVWLDAACSPQRAAADLGIHRQTLYQRLARLAGITGLDLADGADRLRLHLALTLLPALDAHAAPGAR
ncbi:CdaR family transcriptional regulator [Kineosporia sp. A_224]|uniref:PucR family transcriptional regulator n=1 Tax=Kineosporia sp. A_224 TaxID=1962180 RepID=UPI000B4BA228|nr:helix-turn-helix domain-containing protein [Kineosporia sp. A_224]